MALDITVGNIDEKVSVDPDETISIVNLNYQEGPAPRRKCPVDEMDADEDTFGYDNEGSVSCLSTKRKFILHDDISEGLELHPVRVWNDLDDTITELPKFEYFVGLEDVEPYERTPCVCQCVKECNIRCHCIVQPRDVKVTESAYSEDTGLLLTPTKWDLPIICNVPRSIWECSAKCPCGETCYNRCLQFGSRFKFEIFFTGKEKGWGVRAKHNIPAGAFVAEYSGQLMPEPEGEHWASEATVYHYQLGSIREPTEKSRKEGKRYYVDASRKGNFTRFINHSCCPNCVPIAVFYDDNNPEKGMHTGIFTSKIIKRNKELTLNYGDDFWNAKKESGQYCKCGYVNCAHSEEKVRLKNGSRIPYPGQRS